MKSLQFIAVIMVMNLLLSFSAAFIGASQQTANNTDIQTISAYDGPFDIDIFTLSVSRDSSENERESLEQGKGYLVQILSGHIPANAIYPQNTLLPSEITISRDTPPPRLFA